MSSSGSVTHWVRLLQAGDHAAAQPLWERYFQQLVRLDGYHIDTDDALLLFADTMRRYGLAEGFAFEGEVYASVSVMSIFDLYLQHEALLPVV